MRLFGWFRDPEVQFASLEQMPFERIPQQEEVSYAPKKERDPTDASISSMVEALEEVRRQYNIAYGLTQELYQDYIDKHECLDMALEERIDKLHTQKENCIKAQEKIRRRPLPIDVVEDTVVIPIKKEEEKEKELPYVPTTEDIAEGRWGYPPDISRYWSNRQLKDWYHQNSVDGYFPQGWKAKVAVKLRPPTLSVDNSQKSQGP